MTPTSYLFDTSVLIPLLRQEPNIQQRFNASGAGYVSSIALGELYFGARLSQQTAQGLQDIAVLSQLIQVVVPDSITADTYSLIKLELRTAGKMIPENDMWIAASARQYNLILATRDAHFSNISGLQSEQW